MEWKFEGPRIIIRPLKLEDSESLTSNINYPEVAKWTLNIPHPYYIEDAKSFIISREEPFKRNQAYTFGIALKVSDEVIGGIDLAKLDWDNKSGELGYWLGRKFWGKGLMSEAVRLILDFGFNGLDLHRIWAIVYEGNIASRKVLERNGFTLEGVLRETLLRGGKWHNELRYGLLQSEYIKRRPNPQVNE